MEFEANGLQEFGLEDADLGKSKKLLKSSWKHNARATIEVQKENLKVAGKRKWVDLDCTRYDDFPNIGAKKFCFKE